VSEAAAAQAACRQNPAAAATGCAGHDAAGDNSEVDFTGLMVVELDLAETFAARQRFWPPKTCGK